MGKQKQKKNNEDQMGMNWDEMIKFNLIFVLVQNKQIFNNER